MAKPTDLPVWATDTNYSSGPESGQPTKIEPAADFQEEGFKPATYPRPQHFNWWMNLVHQWVQYVDAGVYEEITVEGLATFEDDVVMEGELYYTTERTISVAGGSGRFDVNSGAGGSGAVSRPFGGTTGSVKVSTAFASGATLTWDIPGLRPGDRIKSVTLRARDTDGVTAPAIGGFDAYTVTRTGSTNAVSSTMTNIALTGTYADVIMTAGTPVTLAAGDFLQVNITGTVSQNVEIQSVEVVIDRPAP